MREIFDTATAEFTGLRSQVRSLEDELGRERRKSTSLAADCARLEKALERAQARANKFASMLFAVKSEKLKVADIDAGEDAVVVESAAAQVIREGTGPAAPPGEGQAAPIPPQEAETQRRGAKKGHAGSGRKIPENLPVEETRVDIPARDLVCPVCGEAGVEKPGLETVSYQLTVRKQYVLRQIVRVA